MSSHQVQVVQFVHPGFEYHRREHVGARSTRFGLMGWKAGKSTHDRKFMLTTGSLFDWNAGQEHVSVSIVFWGEWEGPSVFWRVNSRGEPYASIVHAPFRPAHYPSGSVQNTDPMVFGEAFIYSNCLQASRPALRALRPGSIVLFGRHARPTGRPPYFSLDTCLVVDRVASLTPIPFAPDRWGTDLLADSVLCPLHSEGANGRLTVYFGKRHQSGDTKPFSFFPARIALAASPPLFARPELRPVGALNGVVNPELRQSIKLSPQVTLADRDAIWAEVLRQVTEQGCGLGYWASPPPRLEDEAAESAARNPPRPLVDISGLSPAEHK